MKVGGSDHRDLEMSYGQKAVAKYVIKKKKTLSITSAY